MISKAYESAHRMTCQPTAKADKTFFVFRVSGRRRSQSNLTRYEAEPGSMSTSRGLLQAGRGGRAFGCMHIHSRRCKGVAPIGGGDVLRFNYRMTSYLSRGKQQNQIETLIKSHTAVD